MPLLARARLARWIVLALAAGVAVAVVAPGGIAHTSGMFKDSSDYPHDFDQFGCTSCHTGGDGPAHTFVADGGHIVVNITGADGKELAGDQYDPHATYTINVALLNEQNPEADNHAGFNVQVSAGKLATVPSDAHVQVSKDFSQATHLDPKETHWTVGWTPPASGAVEMRILVNDVNGDGVPSGADHVFRTHRVLTDASGAHLGAAASGEPVEFGVTLQQYWIGLIGLAGMLFVMVAGFVYIKLVNPHSSDAKDR